MKTCSINNCNDKSHAKGFCSKHYCQIKRGGQIKERTRLNKHEFCYIPWANVYEFQIYDTFANPTATFIIDPIDFEMTKKYKWSSSDFQYVRRIGKDSSGNKERIFLHRSILGLTKHTKQVVDHINGDGLDNRRCNLRIVTQHQNCMNHQTNKNNKSGVNGIYYLAVNNTWKVKITINHKVINLGSFKDFGKACKVRKEAEEKYYGEYKCINEKRIISPWRI
jgi:hypothetical protein